MNSLLSSSARIIKTIASALAVILIIVPVIVEGQIQLISYKTVK